MHTVEIQVFTFSELSDAAKQRARDWWRSCDPYPWSDENRDSIEKFCDRYGARLKDWTVGPYAPIDYRLEMPPGMLRGVKLRDINRDAMPTGYHLDCALYRTFHDEWKRTGDPRAAFDAAIHAAFHAWREDWEYSLSDEAVDESLEINEYIFTADGRIF